MVRRQLKASMRCAFRSIEIVGVSEQWRKATDAFSITHRFTAEYIDYVDTMIFFGDYTYFRTRTRVYADMLCLYIISAGNTRVSDYLNRRCTSYAYIITFTRTIPDPISLSKNLFQLKYRLTVQWFARVSIFSWNFNL